MLRFPGCAIITTDISGNPEVVGNAGILIARRDAEVIRRAVLILTADPERCRRLGARAAHPAPAEFIWLAVSRYLALLAEVSSAREGTPCASA